MATARKTQRPRSRSPTFVVANRYRIGMWVALAAIVMMFTALTSAYIVRALGNDWRPLRDAASVSEHGADSDQQRHARNGATKVESVVDDGVHKRWLLITVLARAWLSRVAIARLAATGAAGSLCFQQSAQFVLLSVDCDARGSPAGWFARPWFICALRSRAIVDRSASQARGAADAALYWHFMDGFGSDFSGCCSFGS